MIVGVGVFLLGCRDITYTQYDYHQYRGPGSYLTTNSYQAEADTYIERQ